VRRDTEVSGRAGGYGSLVAIGAVFLVTGLLAAWTGPFLHRAQAEDKLRLSWEAQVRLEEKAAALLAEISDATDGDAEEILAFNLPQDARLEDSGSRINLNWARRYILRDSPAILGLFTALSPDELQAYRQKAVLGTDLTAYSAFFDEVTLSEYFTLDTPLNVNCVDEFAFENVMSYATGSESSGSAWRDRLRELRLSGKRLADEDKTRAWFGSDWDKAKLFVSATPEWNANTLHPFLLRAVLSCAEFKIANPAAAAGTILATRDARYLSVSDLRTLLGLLEDNALWLHLGDTSSAWKLSLSNGEGLSIEVNFKPRAESESGPAFRILTTRFSHS